MSEYNDLLKLLKNHIDFFKELADTEQKKLDAARMHDIPTLEECMKKEQADTLIVRGYDKKRLELMEKLSLKDMTLRQMIPLLPKEYQPDFSDTFKDLTAAYSHYKKISDCAKEAIELNLHSINVDLENLRKKTQTASGRIYSHEGTVSTDSLTFKDIKI